MLAPRQWGSCRSSARQQSSPAHPELSQVCTPLHLHLHRLLLLSRLPLRAQSRMTAASGMPTAVSLAVPRMQLLQLALLLLGLPAALQLAMQRVQAWMTPLPCATWSTRGWKWRESRLPPRLGQRHRHRRNNHRRWEQRLQPHHRCHLLRQWPQRRRRNQRRVYHHHQHLRRRHPIRMVVLTRMTRHMTRMLLLHGSRQ